MNQNNEMPIGLAMELAKNSKAMEQFSSLSKSEQNSVIEHARHVHSQKEMQNFISTFLLFDRYS